MGLNMFSAREAAIDREVILNLAATALVGAAL